MNTRQIAHFISACVVLLGLGLGNAAQRDYPIRPVPFTEVKLTDPFWAPRIETNRTETIPYAFGKCEENGRMDNFDIAAGVLEGQHKGDFPFDDTDPYKILEGAAYVLSVQPDPELDAYLDKLIAKIAGAQEDDGYLYTVSQNYGEEPSSLNIVSISSGNSELVKAISLGDSWVDVNIVGDTAYLVKREGYYYYYRDEEAEEWEQTLAAAGFFNQPSSLNVESGADAFVYKLTVVTAEQEHTALWSDEDAPEELRPLLRRLTVMAR